MNTVQRLLIAIALLGFGFFGAQAVVTMFPSDETWERQVQADALTAVEVLRPWDVEQLPEEFWERWNSQIASYDDERLADLRSRLDLYLDFLDAEYAEAAEIYTSGSDPNRRSEGIRALRDRLPGAFGEAAEQMIADADVLREHAYSMSPRHGGLDPDAPDFRLEAESLRTWLTIARPRVDALTRQPEDR